MGRILQLFGAVGQIIGLVVIVIAFNIDTTVESAGGVAVANFQGMHFQLLWFQLGAVLFLSGTFSLVGGAICDRLQGPSRLRAEHYDAEERQAGNPKAVAVILVLTVLAMGVAFWITFGALG